MDELFDQYIIICDEINNCFGQDISPIIINFYDFEIKKKIRLTKKSKINLNSNEVEKQNYTIILSNLNNVYYEYNKHYYDSFDGDTSVTNEKLNGKFKFIKDEILINGILRDNYSSYKGTFDEDGISKTNTNEKSFSFKKDELIKWNFEYI